MKTLLLIVSAAILAACASGGSKSAARSGLKASAPYQITDSEKIGNALRLTFATEWPSIQCSATIDGLKVGSGQGNSLAGVAKVSIYVPSKYEPRPVRDFVIQCSQF